jgi:hypothetical protein
MEKTNKVRLGLYINYKTTGANYYDKTTSIDFDFGIVTISENDEIRNLGHSYSDNPNKWLDDIAISMRYYSSEYDKSDHPYSHYCSIFFDGYHPDVNTLDRAAKSLKKIHAHLERLNTKRGYAVDGPDYIGRFCEACGIDCMVERTTDNRGSSYTDNQHKIMTVGNGLDTLRYILKNDKVFNTAVEEALKRAA